MAVNADALARLTTRPGRSVAIGLIVGGLIVVCAVAAAALYFTGKLRTTKPATTRIRPKLDYRAKQYNDIGGFAAIAGGIKRWPPEATLEELRDTWKAASKVRMQELDKHLAKVNLPLRSRASGLITKAGLLNYDGQAERAYEALAEARALAESNNSLAAPGLYTIIYYQGVTALRRGENDNCIMCRGESSCIIPIAPAAIHTNPIGSRLAIEHFTEYLEQFPDDLEARWLLNIAHMTLGEHPSKVDPRFLISLDRWVHSEFDIGKFRDIGHIVGVNRLNQAGGAIMDDFDNDGLLDIVFTAMDPTESMAFFRNKGDGNFEDRTKAAGLSNQLGGLYCIQADYNNDGWLDIFIPRGAWQLYPMRPTLLRNNGNGRFTDVTSDAGLLHAVNSNSACWGDYDNDGWLDLFVCAERQPNRLYHSRKDGTFEEVASQAGVDGKGETMCKGATWIDYDNDGYSDLFVDFLSGDAHLYRNNHDGTFADVNAPMGIDGPRNGFACWAWDYDNDGYLDIFATSYDRTLGDIVKGLIGEPHGRESNRLFRNVKGKGFENVTKDAGLDMVFATMGSNFADLDNDGYLDMYLGTGEPDIATLVPNRMFKNVAGQRFAEISGSSGTGHLQKGHAVACGDWDRDGDVDMFVEMGGTTHGDKYHNILFDNPGQGNHWLTVKLVGEKTNRAAIGARIKVVTAGQKPLTVHRHVSSGGSFGANTLEQMIGLAKADRVALLEIYWPTSGTIQVFRDIAAGQIIEVTEFAKDYRVLPRKVVPRRKS
jgi:hypothetical protein